MADMTEMEKLRAGLSYRYDDPELVEMKDTASMRCDKFNAVDPLDAAGREAAARELVVGVGGAGHPARVPLRQRREHTRRQALHSQLQRDHPRRRGRDLRRLLHGGAGHPHSDDRAPDRPSGPPRPPRHQRAHRLRRRRVGWRQLHHPGRRDRGQQRGYRRWRGRHQGRAGQLRRGRSARQSDQGALLWGRESAMRKVVLCATREKNPVTTSSGCRGANVKWEGEIRSKQPDQEAGGYGRCWRSAVKDRADGQSQLRIPLFSRYGPSISSYREAPSTSRRLFA